MRRHGHRGSLTGWLRLLLACLAVGSAVSPAQVVSAVEPVCVAQGGPGGPDKKPAETLVRAEVPARRSALGLSTLAALWAAVAAGGWRFIQVRRPADPRPSSPPRFLLHRALLN